MIFEFAPAPDANITAVTHPAPHAFKQMMTGMHVTEHRCNNDYILQQQERAIYTNITQHHFQLQNESRFVMRSEKPLIILFYTISGQIATYTELLGVCHLKKDQYFLYYLPRGEHPIIFTAGNCITMKVEVDLQMLAALTDQHPYLAYFHRHASEAPGTGWRLPVMRTCHHGRKVLSDITQSKLTGGRRAMFMHRNVSMLLALYLDDLSRHQQDATPRYRYSDDEVNRLNEMQQALGKKENWKIKVELLARQFGFSYNKAIQGFQRFFGKDITTLRNEKIADEICRLLLETDHSVNQIASDMELGESPNLINFFKRMMGGLTPTQYRRKHARDEEAQ
jgi:AraC-like DNA-binding protein